MTTAFFVGNMFGSIILVIFGSKLATGKLLSFYMLMYATFSYLFFSFTNVFLSGICLFISGAFISIWNANVFNLIQTISDEKYMGRVVSFFFTMFILIGLGFILGGIFGDIIGINLTILISCLAVIILHILIIVSSKKYRLLKLQ